jgi:hypothetical protein
MEVATLIPCEPYVSDTFHLVEGRPKPTTIIGYWVRLRDTEPVAGVALHMNGKHWLCLTPAYEFEVAQA